MVVTRRLWPALAAVLVAAVAVGALLLARQPTPPLSNRVDSVAKTLRCPTCEGESVAASDTPIARSMRVEIAHQLRAGRSPDQVRAWFVQRYGASIVTTPSTRGPELLLWVLPIVVLAAGLLLLLARVRARPRPPAAAVPGGRIGGASGLSGRRVLVAAVVCAVAGVAVPAAVALPKAMHPVADAAAPTTSASGRLGPSEWLRVARSLDRQGDVPGAERAYRRALALRPASAQARARLGFDLLRQRRLRAAERLVGRVAGRSGPQRPLALLVLGLAQRGRGQARADATLRTFLRVAPHDPAAPQVRRLLRGRG